MEDKMVKIKLHGKLGEKFRGEYLLKVSSVSEALHAIDSIHHSGFRRYMLDQKNIYKKWTVLTNGKKVNAPENVEDLKTNEINCFFILFYYNTYNMLIYQKLLKHLIAEVFFDRLFQFFLKLFV